MGLISDNDYLATKLKTTHIVSIGRHQTVWFRL